MKHVRRLEKQGRDYGLCGRALFLKGRVLSKEETVSLLVATKETHANAEKAHMAEHHQLTKNTYAEKTHMSPYGIRDISHIDHGSERSLIQKDSRAYRFYGRTRVYGLSVQSLLGFSHDCLHGRVDLEPGVLDWIGEVGAQCDSKRLNDSLTNNVVVLGGHAKALVLQAQGLQDWHQRLKVSKEGHGRAHGGHNLSDVGDSWAAELEQGHGVLGGASVLEGEHLQRARRLLEDLHEDHLSDSVGAEHGHAPKGLLHQVDITLVNWGARVHSPC